MDYNEIKKLVKLVETSGIDELELEENGSKIRIAKIPNKGFGGSEMVTYIPQGQGFPAPQYSQQPQGMAAPAASSDTAEPVAPKSNLLQVKSPMVGTFYRSPSPEAPSYVNIGDKVRPGQTLCILEAMKLMNEIECEVSGRIVSIVVDNAQPVEYGQVLFNIEPD